MDLAFLVYMEKKDFLDKRVKRVMLDYPALQELKDLEGKEEAQVHLVFLDKRVKKESLLL